MIDNLVKYINRFWVRTTVNDNKCWIWNGTNNRHGLVTIRINKIADQVYLHRFIFCLLHKLDYKGKFLVLHICNISLCWNPLHLYKGNNSDNQRDAVKAGTHSRTARTICKNGHEYTRENTYRYFISKTQTWRRACKICRDNSNRNRVKIGKR